LAKLDELAPSLPPLKYRYLRYYSKHKIEI
jgi:hypothetical protein